MKSSTVELTWDGRPKTFNRDMLDTTWLVKQDVAELDERNSADTLRIYRKLLELGFESHTAKIYAVASWQYDPDV